MNPFQNIAAQDKSGLRQENGGATSISSATTTSSREGDSVFRRMLWNRYSTSLHFFGGSLFPTTTTATTPLYNSPHYADTSTFNNSYQRDSRECYDYDIRSAIKSSFCSDSLSCPRPTDQLLKLIRRRRGVSVSNNVPTPAEANGLNASNSRTTDTRDDSWNSVRYHIVSRPTDCRYVCYSSNLSTPLHAACLYRAPHDVILMLLTAWPAATLQQDSEGWTPLHVHILYNNNTNDNDDTTGTSNLYATSATSSLIRLGGAAAASQHSKFVGSALHLACRHNVSLSILAELLQVCPGQVLIPNEAGGLCANILWKTTMKERQRSCRRRNEQIDGVNNGQTLETNEWHRIEHESNIDLLIRLNLFLGAYLQAPILLEQAQRILPNQPIFTLHDMVRFHFECATQANYVRLFLHIYSSSVSDIEGISQILPIHVAASYAVDDTKLLLIPSDNSDRMAICEEDNEIRNMESSSVNGQQQFVWPPQMPTSANSSIAARQRDRFADRFSATHIFKQIQDPLITILNAFPSGAYTKGGDRNERIPLHVALADGKRKWRTGIAALAAAAPETVEWKDVKTQLYPFQLAAVSENDFDVTTCNHGHESKRKNKDRERSNKNAFIIEVAKLETIFCLLLGCPHVISATSVRRKDRTKNQVKLEQNQCLS